MIYCLGESVTPALWLRSEQAWALTIFFPQRHHAQIAVHVEDERNDAREWLEVEVAIIDFDTKVYREEGEINALGVDPVR